MAPRVSAKSINRYPGARAAIDLEQLVVRNDAGQTCRRIGKHHSHDEGAPIGRRVKPDSVVHRNARHRERLDVCDAVQVVKRRRKLRENVEAEVTGFGPRGKRTGSLIDKVADEALEQQPVDSEPSQTSRLQVYLATRSAAGRFEAGRIPAIQMMRSQERPEDQGSSRVARVQLKMSGDVVRACRHERRIRLEGQR